MRILFAFNRLYVSATRAQKNLYIIEEEDGVQFWKDCKKWGHFPNLEFVDNSEDILEILEKGDFQESVNYSEENLEKQFRKFESQGSLSALRTAIHISDSINHDWKFRLRGIKAEMDARKTNDSDEKANNCNRGRRFWQESWRGNNRKLYP